MKTSCVIKTVFAICTGACILTVLIELIYENKGPALIFFERRSLQNGTWTRTAIWHTKDSIRQIGDLLWNTTTMRTPINVTDMTKCYKKAPFKSRAIKVNLNGPSWSELNTLTAHLKPGGMFEPSKCADPDRVAIIIPYRARESQLKVFLQHMHPFLQRQNLTYTIFIIEQAEGTPFNRGLLMNIGFTEANKHGDFQCHIYHDVDLLPENDANMYTCPTRPDHPRHLSISIDKHNYKLLYQELIGGATVIRKEDFVKLNGFSNLYFQWGGEDDDLHKRINANNMTVTRYAMEIGRYKMINHASEKKNPHRSLLLVKSRKRAGRDGLNSLTYTVVKTDKNTTLYTRILVTVDMKEYDKLIQNALV